MDYEYTILLVYTTAMENCLFHELGMLRYICQGFHNFTRRHYARICPPIPHLLHGLDDSALSAFLMCLESAYFDTPYHLEIVRVKQHACKRNLYLCLHVRWTSILLQ
jgi:hypothetical protein